MHGDERKLAKLFNSRLDGNTRRAIDIDEGEEIGAAAFKALICAAPQYIPKGKAQAIEVMVPLDNVRGQWPHAISRSVQMIPTITAFARSPDRGRGLARDMRVRWALEEVGQPYGVRLVSFTEMKEPAHRALHPFGQIPTYEEGDLALFESGAIVFHIAESHPGLLPDDAKARARAITWMFAALNTVEPPILDREFATLMERDKTWYGERLPILEDRVRVRLGELSSRLGNADWLDAAFSAGDLLMVTVLRRLSGSGLLEGYPNLSAYVARAEARPAYKRAFDDQLAVFTASSSTG